ncbi:MAG: glycoside hydrolase family 3 C-terminal domain-containing protein, partial [Pseudomonadota bacterium]
HSSPAAGPARTCHPASTTPSRIGDSRWSSLHHSISRWSSLLHQVRDGVISEARLEEAVARVLRVKMRAGLFSAGAPSTRPNAGEFDLLGSAAHRAIAREAVRKSLVLLKNNNAVLPMRADANVLVAGDGAHDIGKQSGGWTLSWQGTGNVNEHFPHGVSIFEGLASALSASGGQATLSEDGSFTERPDVAVVVFGEDPYAEFQGDRNHVDFASDDGLQLLTRFREQGIPTVSVFLSGRPMWVNPEINASDAFVAAWLPGTAAGDGIADVLVAKRDGEAKYDFTGRLSFSWPKTAIDVELNVGDPDYDPQFAFGYGMSYSDDRALGQLSLVSGLTGASTIDPGELLAFGDPLGQWSLYVNDASGDTRVGDSRARSATGAVAIAPVDVEAQEDAIIATWQSSGSVFVEGPAVDFSRQYTGDLVLELEYRVVSVDASVVRIGVGEGDGIDVTAALRGKSGGGWQTSVLRLACFTDTSAAMAAVERPVQIMSNGALAIELRRARFVPNPGDASCAL